MKFRFKGFYINEILYDFIEQSAIDPEDNNIGLGLIQNDEKEYELTLGIGHVDDNRKDGKILKIVVKITGKFIVKLEDDENVDIEDVIRRNGANILFPYLRALIQFITSYDTSGEAVLLPTININNLIDKMMNEKEKLEEKQ